MSVFGASHKRRVVPVNDAMSHAARCAAFFFSFSTRLTDQSAIFRLTCREKRLLMQNVMRYKYYWILPHLNVKTHVICCPVHI